MFPYRHPSGIVEVPATLPPDTSIDPSLRNRTLSALTERIVELSVDAIERSASESFAMIDGEPLPVLDLAPQLSLDARYEGSVATLVLVDVRDQRMALRVERVSGQQQIYVKPVPELLAPLRALAGLTILGDGRPVFVLDQNQLA